MKKLILDIENTPHTVHRWGMFDSNPVYPNQLLEPSRLLCFAAKWKGSRTTMFFSPRLFPDKGNLAHMAMVEEAHKLLSEADVVVTYNGRRHDLPTLNREFVLYKFPPPAPYVSLDLYPTVRRKFKFPFGKLDYVAKELGLGRKAKHEGHDLWIACMRGDERAWLRMARYNRQDVKLTEALHDYLQAWTVGAPNARLYVEDDTDVCPKCGVAGQLVKEGFEYASTGKYQRYSCKSCGGWSTDSRRTEGTTVKGVTS